MLAILLHLFNFFFGEILAFIYNQIFNLVLVMTPLMIMEYILQPQFAQSIFKVFSQGFCVYNYCIAFT